MTVRTLVIPFLFLIAALGGCLSSDGDTKETSTASPGPTGTNKTANWTVTILNFTDSANVTDPIQVDWRVETRGNQSIVMDRTAVHYADHTVPDPESPADYGNRSGERLAAKPGNFSANFSINEPSTIFLRAHAEVAGVDYWSKEVQIEVGAKPGQVVTVEMSSALTGILSGFEPEQVTIKKGDAVKWSNKDDQVHTATSIDGKFNTGDVAAGGTSEPIVFEEAGRYSYRCNYHPQTMTGQITVT